MARPYEPLAYGDGPLRDCFWPSTGPEPVAAPPLSGDIACDFAVIGAGYSGLSAALELAGAGGDVVVLDANGPGWGASGRNGGLVSVGSARLDDATIRKRHGAAEAAQFFAAERAAIDHVEHLIDRHGLQVDRHSDGYTFAAHSPAMIPAVRAYGESYARRYGLAHDFLSRADMRGQGMASPDLHAAVNVPLGFALNPMKLVLGLTRAATEAGARLFHGTPVTRLAQEDGHVLYTPGGRVRAGTVIFATNGYGRDDLPGALGGRFLPVQSNILVTRPLSDDEIAAQGWWSAQMVVDSRNLLHYFRLLPDRRMLFGLRGSLRATQSALNRTRRRARADFDRMFPAWRHVETPFFWSGLICMTRGLVPFAGPIPGMDRAFGALGYHGSGVAMAPYAGALAADLALGRSLRAHPAFMRAPPVRFELGRWRRAQLAPAFAWYRLKDSI